MTGIVLAVSYLWVLVVSVPLYLLFVRFGLVSWHYALIGGALTVLPFVGPDLWSAVAHGSTYFLPFVVIYSNLGIASGLVFWLIAFRNAGTPRIRGVRLFIGWSGLLLLLVSNLIAKMVLFQQSLDG